MATSISNHLVLAGGGHSHALSQTLGNAARETSKWHHAGQPQQHSPVFRNGAGLIAGIYQIDELAIDLRQPRSGWDCLRGRKSPVCTLSKTF